MSRPGPDCAAARETLSAGLDGERGPLPENVLRAHLAGCPACRLHGDEIALLSRRLRLEPEPSPPDPDGGLAATVLARIAAERRRRRLALTLRAGAAALALAALPLGVVAASAHAAGRPTHARTPCTAWLERAVLPSPGGTIGSRVP
jgi:predicted anti-sigma-YlaC factor YlaD